MTMAVTQILSYLILILYKSSKNVVKRKTTTLLPHQELLLNITLMLSREEVCSSKYTYCVCLEKVWNRF